MKIPKTIKIGAHTYKISHRDEDGESDSRFGHCFPRNLVIYIDQRVPQSQQEETLIHEVAHAIADQIRAFPNTDNGREDEERVVQGLGHGIYQVLKDNDLLK